MKQFLKNTFNDFLHLFFPHNCMGCGIDVLPKDVLLCAECANQLPYTSFLKHPDNPVEKKFYGRLKIEHAGSSFYFIKNSLMQHLISELKYKGNMDSGFYLGKILGLLIMESGRFDDVECIVPLPLNELKQRKRGYNQATIIAKGITEVWPKPIFENGMKRIVFTETQTHKDRISRWQSMDGVFAINNKNDLENKHVLLVDDVVTTGATLEACGLELLKAEGSRLSLATVAYTI